MSTVKGKRFFKFYNYKFRFVAGLVLIGVSLFLLIAFTSFFQSGYADRSKFDIPFWEVVMDTSIEADNFTGKFGAWFADLFINRWFGIASFSVVFLIFLAAMRMLGARILPFRKSVIHAALITIWLSITLGFFFVDALQDRYLMLGGAHGYFVSLWLQTVIGWIGTLIFLLLSLLIYLTITFDWFIPFITRKLKLNSLFIKPGSDDDSGTKPDVDGEAGQSENVNLDGNDTGSDPDSKRDGEDEGDFEEEFKVITKGKSDQELPFNGNTVAGDDDLELKIEQTATEESYRNGDNKPQGDYDPTLDLSSYRLPVYSLLESHGDDDIKVTREELISNKNQIVNTLKDYKIEIKDIKATVGPTITLYEIVPMPGVRISKIKNLEDDIALSLAALGIRIIAPIPGRGTIGIEVPNSEPEIVSMRSIIGSKRFQNSKAELPVAIGKTISNEAFIFDLTKAPHLLVAGATGQGKSVGLNAIITSLLYKKHPSQLKFVLVDPKKVELNIYSKIERHFLAKMPDEEEPIITEVPRVVNTLNSLTIEMDDRYELLKKAHTRNIKEYNHKFTKRRLNPEDGHRFLPYIVVIIDEFADLIMTAGKEVELPIARIAQLARAVGIHMIIATQRPSTNIITGVIKANFPSRIAFKVASMIDSRTILDSPGANQLIGRGDMLISQGSDLIRVQCAFVDTPEVEKVNDYIGEQRGYPSAMMLPEYVGENGSQEQGEVDLAKRDSIFEEAARIVVSNQSGSTSLIQRRFSIGYNRAGRVIDQLEAAGIVGPFEGSKARRVLVNDEMELDRVLEAMK
ncbi:DNA translocase FtsK [Marinilabiliaceae bacterium ANBcel2]|nr:DNA translocase FtsK [Marinilabiliaceae bacterium ANBcel2]